MGSRTGIPDGSTPIMYEVTMKKAVSGLFLSVAIILAWLEVLE